jgi:adenylate cyclase
MKIAARHRPTYSLVGLTVALGLLVSAVAQFLPPEAWLTDLRLGFLSPAPPGQDDRLVVVAITEQTISKLPYRSPVDRGFLAQLVTVIDAAEPSAIGIDILFDQASELEKDKELIDTLRSSKAPIVLGVVANHTVLSKTQRGYLSNFVAASKAQQGYVDLPTDRDGAIRLRPDSVDPKKKSLSTAIVRAAGNDVPAFGGLLAMRPSTDDTLPIAVLPAHIVVQMAKVRPSVVTGWLSGRIVVIGADLPLQDRHRTALRLRVNEPDLTPGVLIHAHAISQALDGYRIREIPNWLVIVTTMIGALLGAGLAGLRWPLWTAISAGLFLVATYWAVTGYLFRSHWLLLPMAAPALTTAIAFGMGSALLGYSTFQQKRYVRRAFAQYVPAQVVEVIARDPSQLKLGGETRELTFIFTDIAGFTSMSERMSPDQLGEMLNQYLDGVSTIISDHGGTLDKYIGDAVVAFFGAPAPQSDHAANAIVCAAEIDCFAESFRGLHAATGFGATRIGVHTGKAVVGNFGGSRRFEYTAIGDSVNVAARLESANKHLGSRVCISAATVESASSSNIALPALRPIGCLLLKGKAEPIQSFEPLSKHDPRFLSLSDYKKSYDAMAAGKTAEALRGFDSLEKVEIGDDLVKYHKRRLTADPGSTELIVMQEK